MYYLPRLIASVFMWLGALGILVALDSNGFELPILICVSTLIAIWIVWTKGEQSVDASYDKAKRDAAEHGMTAELLETVLPLMSDDQVAELRATLISKEKQKRQSDATRLETQGDDRETQFYVGDDGELVAYQ